MINHNVNINLTCIYVYIHMFYLMVNDHWIYMVYNVVNSMPQT